MSRARQRWTGIRSNLQTNRPLFVFRMGYFVPYSYLPSFALTISIPASSASTIVGLANAFGAIGRVVMGFIADRAGAMNMWAVCFQVASWTVLVVWTNVTNYSGVLAFGE